MLIGELSKKTGLSRDTIRFYEKQGLIAVGRKERRFNNYKEYSSDTLQRLLQIKRIKSFGFTLAETAEFLAMIENKEASCGSVSEKFAEKVGLIDQKITQLIGLRSLMQSGVENCLRCCSPEDEDENCPLLTSELLSEGK